jgi:hypothetical protein
MHIEEFNDLCFSPNVIRVIKSRSQMGWTCCTYRGEVECIQGFCWGNLRERDDLEDPTVDRRIILNGFLKSGVVAWTGLMCLGVGAV